MADAIVVINAGSSSVKFAVFHVGPGSVLRMELEGQVDGIGTRPHFSVTSADGAVQEDRDLAGVRGDDHGGAMAEIRAWLDAHRGGDRVVAVGHRVVHGGQVYAAPVLVDARVIAELDRLVPLAPLHQPHNVAAIRAVAATTPELPQVACFDTAFHRTQPPVAQAFALPRELTDEGVHRYGFHGLSYEYIASALPGAAPEVAERRVIVLHLGNGASLCAMERGRSVATTMGFSALDGLAMGTRPGTLDPGVLLYLMAQHGMDAHALEMLLYNRSGLLGVSGVSSDMRELLGSHDVRAREAVDLFVYRIARELGSLAAALGGLDALVFTAGIGEHAPEIRARVCRDARWLGVGLDEAANRDGGPRISPAGAGVSAWVIPTDENLMIARHTAALLAARRDGSRA
jgi:acetate kinase